MGKKRHKKRVSINGEELSSLFFCFFKKIGCHKKEKRWKTMKKKKLKVFNVTKENYTIAPENLPWGKIFKVLFIFVVCIILLGGVFYTIPAGHRGILLTFGKPSEITSTEGFHFKIPIAQKVVKMEVRTQKIEVEADSSSKDLQDVHTTIALNFHIIPSETNKLYQNIGLSYQERIIHPAIQEAVKAVSATFTAEELITKRPQVRDNIKDFLIDKLSNSYIIVDDFNIVNFQFSDEFDKAIEAKVTAEQLKLKADRDLERIIVEKEQKITRAQAEAEALRLQKQEITQELIQLRQIEMMMAAIEKWNGVMPEATSGMPFIDVSPKSLNIKEVN